MNSENSESSREGEIIEPPGVSGDAAAHNSDSLIALIANYTERPDLLISEIEKHDPGFIKRMNEKAELRSERTANARFLFGGTQAYVALAISAISALVVLGVFAYAIVNAIASFWLVIGMAIFYAVSQSGVTGFLELCRGVADLIRRGKSSDE